MKKITKIERKGQTERYYLYVDNELFGVFEAEILARHSLKSGQMFDDDFFERLMIENGDYACFNRSLSLLEKSMKTKFMLKKYLKEKLYPLQCIDRAIEKLESYGYINDEVFCENFINSYAQTKSKRKLKYDLISKGVDEEIVESKLSEMISDEDEYDLCLKLAKKYLKNKEIDLKTKQKFYNHLVGKGFNFSLISSVWEEVSCDRN